MRACCEHFEKKAIAGFVLVLLKCELENFRTLLPGNIPLLNVCHTLYPL
jgi:hypothetical protein